MKRIALIVLVLTVAVACKGKEGDDKKGSAKTSKKDASKKDEGKKDKSKTDDGAPRDIKIISRFSGVATPVSYKGLPPEGEKIVKRESVVKSEADWKALLGMIPRKLPRKGAGSTDNSDSILKAKMPDFSKHMVIATARVNSIFAKPVIKKLVAEKGVLTVHVFREKAVPEQHPIDWGSYNAVIIEKFDGQVKFVWTDAK